MSDCVVGMVTCGSKAEARALARAVLEPKLAACVNIVAGVESHYWWQGKLESGTEALLVLKTTKPKLSALEKLILARHPYDTPEFVVLPLHAGTPRYLDWLAASVKARR